MPSAPLETNVRSRLKHVSALGLMDFGPDPALDRLIRCLHRAMGGRAIALLVAGADRISIASGVDWTLGDVRTDDGMFQEIARAEGVREWTADSPAFPHCRPLFGHERRWRRFAAIRIQSGDHLVGVLGVADESDRPFSPEERATLVDGRDIVEHEFELRGDSTRDALTGLLNRRFATFYVARENRRATREQTPVSYILIDIDRFKLYNDRYGHVAGDQALREFAYALQGCCRRPADLVIRLGGEEFLIVLPSTDLAGCERLLERLHDAVAQVALVHSGSPTGHLTFTAGAVVAMGPGDLKHSLSEIVEAADRHLYAAKNAGRNQSRVATFGSP